MQLLPTLMLLTSSIACAHNSIAGVLTEKEEEAALALAERQPLKGGQAQTVDELLEDPYVPPLVVLWRWALSCCARPCFFLM